MPLLYAIFIRDQTKGGPIQRVRPGSAGFSEFMIHPGRQVRTGAGTSSLQHNPMHLHLEIGSRRSACLPSRALHGWRRTGRSALGPVRNRHGEDTEQTRTRHGAECMVNRCLIGLHPGSAGAGATGHRAPVTRHSTLVNGHQAENSRIQRVSSVRCSVTCVPKGDHHGPR